MAKQESITLLQFQERFQTEESCYEHLFNIRWPNGFICPVCGHTEYYALPKRKLFQCKACKHQTSVTAGTVMHRTRTPLLKWFWAIFLTSHDKRGISAQQLMADLELSDYVAYLMLHKIRKAMGDQDQNYQLGGLVELDETFFGAPTEGGKRGRGTDKTPVLVGLSLDKAGRPKYVKMNVISDVKGETLANFAKTNIAPGSTISSDALKSYNKLAEEGFIHEPVKFNAKDNPDHLKWLHTFIGNAKAFVGGTYHGLDSVHLQPYLDVFCYRSNHRKFKGEIFNRLLSACSLNPTISYTNFVHALRS